MRIQPESALEEKKSISAPSIEFKRAAVPCASGAFLFSALGVISELLLRWLRSFDGCVQRRTHSFPE